MVDDASDPPRFYGDLAVWWPLISPVEDYAEESAFAATVLDRASIPVRSVLELGSGGGHSAFHLKARHTMTLVDLSAEMLAVSKRLNPECDHAQGDMRTVRLDRTLRRGVRPRRHRLHGDRVRPPARRRHRVRPLPAGRRCRLRPRRAHGDLRAGDRPRRQRRRRRSGRPLHGVVVGPRSR